MLQCKGVHFGDNGHALCGWTGTAAIDHVGEACGLTEMATREACLETRAARAAWILTGATASLANRLTRQICVLAGGGTRRHQGATAAPHDHPHTSCRAQVKRLDAKVVSPHTTPCECQ